MYASPVLKCIPILHRVSPVPLYAFVILQVARKYIQVQVLFIVCQHTELVIISLL